MFVVNKAAAIELELATSISVTSEFDHDLNDIIIIKQLFYVQ